MIKLCSELGAEGTWWTPGCTVTIVCIVLLEYYVDIGIMSGLNNTYVNMPSSYALFILNS